MNLRADTLPRYMPYGGGHKPFSIGLSALEPERWIEPDDALGAYLAEKQRLLATSRDEVFRAVDESVAAQEELLAMLAGHLVSDHGDLYRRDGDVMQMAGHSVDLADDSMPPLIRAGLMVQDDLAVLLKTEEGWQLAAGFIAFPSSWSLAEKAGRPMEQVHGNVPGFGDGTRNAALINRIFDNLRPDLPAARLNWSFKGSASLAMPVSKHRREDPFKPVHPLDRNFLRVERQTLRRLPETGAVVFTIHIYSDPLTAIAAHPERSAIAEAMIGQLRDMKPAERAYKDMSDADVDALIGWLAEQAGNPAEASERA